ncbi:MAG: hypothetical protein KDA83_22050, partial [Planctomycetales bacterium]|nr:hypothetical protein [Planctomycetales bacterium]
DDFVEELARWLAPHGWQVSPASVKRDAEKHPTLYTFEITVREQSEAWFTRELEPVPSPDTTMVPPTTRSSVQPVPITRLGTASDVPTFASSRGNGSRDVKNQRKPEA